MPEEIIGRRIEKNSVKVKSFEEMLRDAERAGHTNTLTANSMKWFMDDYANKFKGTLTSGFMRVEKDQLTTQIKVGKMYVFLYDPKHKDTLAYYDRSPCIFPIERYSDGFLGINLHYLPPILRVKLLDALFELVNKPKLPENRKLNISYQILKSAAASKWFKPCIKRYLSKHVKSRFLEVPYDNWGQVPFLPISQFEGAPITQIWSDSRNAL